MDSQNKAGCNLAIIGGSVAAVLMVIAYIYSKCRRKATPLTCDDLGILTQMLHCVDNYWVAIAVQLRMISVVANIRGTPENTRPADFMRDLIYRWLNQECPILEDLCQAMRNDSEIIEGVIVANQLEKKFQGRRAWSMLSYLLVGVAAVVAAVFAAVFAAPAVYSLLSQVVSPKEILDGCKCTDITSGVITVLPSSGNTKLTSDDQFDVTVVANSSGDFVLPDCCQGAHKQSIDSFTFAIANNSQRTLRYMFDKLDKTNFSVNSGRIATGISSSYVLSLRMQQEDSTVYPTTYVAYFYSHPVQNLRWKIRIVIEPAGSPSEKVDEENWWNKGLVQFQFAGEEIHLGLAGGSNTSDDGCWKIIALTSDTINVKRFKKPSADCSVEWMRKCMHTSPEPYYHVFHLHGTEPTAYYAMYMDPNQVPHSSKMSSEPTSSGALCDRPDLLKLRNLPSKSGSIDVIEQIGTDYYAFGTELLNDESGARVEAIVKEYRYNAEQINLEILRLWILGRGKPVSWYTLIHVLRVIKRKTLAGDIEDSLRHCTINT